MNKLQLLLLVVSLVRYGGTQSVEDCIEIVCSTYGQINTLWCHKLPTHFCQCRPTPIEGIWEPQVMPCAEETVFSFRHQVCVHPDMRNGAECFDEITDDIDETLCIDPPAPCETFKQINQLKCHNTEKRFCQCRPLTSNPSVWVAVAMPCAEETSFSFYHQTCTRDELWTNSCPAV
ncbi:uncharacterized protein LOC129724856 [Wyeomyia smithii]|uniref:uncharacterized protein LOC129724856 n=1 Tax=Wyeomyia smithii TaxID=174621 RepID=UPI0024681919|nr:uncharacterized protein LOC129724856 [Wyeomyia smithii]